MNCTILMPSYMDVNRASVSSWLRKPDSDVQFMRRQEKQRARSHAAENALFVIITYFPLKIGR